VRAVEVDDVEAHISGPPGSIHPLALDAGDVTRIHLFGQAAPDQLRTVLGGGHADGS